MQSAFYEFWMCWNNEVSWSSLSWSRDSLIKYSDKNCSRAFTGDSACLTSSWDRLSCFLHEGCTIFSLLATTLKPLSVRWITVIISLQCNVTVRNLESWHSWLSYLTHKTHPNVSNKVNLFMATVSRTVSPDTPQKLLRKGPAWFYLIEHAGLSPSPRDPKDPPPGARQHTPPQVYELEEAHSGTKTQKALRCYSGTIRWDQTGLSRNWKRTVRVNQNLAPTYH